MAGSELAAAGGVRRNVIPPAALHTGRAPANHGPFRELPGRGRGPGAPGIGAFAAAATVGRGGEHRVGGTPRTPRTPRTPQPRTHGRAAECRSPSPPQRRWRRGPRLRFADKWLGQPQRHDPRLCCRCRSPLPFAYGPLAHVERLVLLRCLQRCRRRPGTHPPLAAHGAGHPREPSDDRLAAFAPGLFLISEEVHLGRRSPRQPPPGCVSLLSGPADKDAALRDAHRCLTCLGGRRGQLGDIRHPSIASPPAGPAGSAAGTKSGRRAGSALQAAAVAGLQGRGTAAPSG